MKNTIFLLYLLLSCLVSTAQTRPTLVADLTPGSGNTRFGRSAVFYNKLVFIADNTGTVAFPQQLWISDGTAAGTFVLRDFGTGNQPRGFTALNGKLYFVALEVSSGWELWGTDGTAAGTTMVKEINPGAYNAISGTPVQLGNKLYFLADDGNGIDVWVSDGTAAGTYSLIDLNLSNISGVDIGNLVTINNKLCFTQAPSGVGNYQLWVADPITKSAAPFNLSGSVTNGVIVAGNKLYFTVSNPSPFGPPNFGFYVSDGTWAGTVLLAPQMRHYSDHVEMADKLYFYATSNYGTMSGNDGIWVTNGTVAGTKLVKDTILNNCFSSSDPRTIPLTVLKNKIYFGCGGTKPYNNELWVSDGTTAGTHMMMDFSPPGSGGQYFYPRSFVATGDYFYFKTWDETTRMVNLWVSDGTTAGTRMITPPAVSGFQTTNICEVITATTQLVDTTIFFANSYDRYNTGLELYALPALKAPKDTVADTTSLPFSLQFYPNPTSGNFNINITSNEPFTYMVSLTAIDGKIVKQPQEIRHTTPGKQQLPYPMNELPNGIYILQFISSKQSQCHKIVVCH